MADVKLIYKDIQTDMQRNCAMTVSDKQGFVNLDYFAPVMNYPPQYGTLEKDYFLLDGSFQGFANNPESDITGYISEQLSSSSVYADDDNEVEYYPFNNPIVFTRKFAGYHTTEGVTIQFDTAEFTYCPLVKIDWYKDGNLIINEDSGESESKYFKPVSNLYFCRNKVELFDELIITFYGLNRANRFMRIYNIYDGEIKEFSSVSRDQLMSLEVLAEMSVLGIELKSSTLTFTIETDYGKDYAFIPGQPIDMYIDNGYFATFYVDKAKQLTASRFEIHASDILTSLDNQGYMYEGYIDSDWNNYYNNNSYETFTVEQWFKKYITDLTGVSVFVADDYKDIPIKGILRNNITYRTAAQYVIAAIGASVITTGTIGMRIINYIGNNYHDIEQNITFFGGDLEKSESVTGVEVVKYNVYEKSTGLTEWYRLTDESGKQYDEISADTEFPIYFKSSEPLLGIKMEKAWNGNGSDSIAVTFINPYEIKVEGTIAQDHFYRIMAKFALLLGKTSFSRKNTEIIEGTPQNIKKFSQCTLIMTDDQAEAVAENLLGYYSKTLVLRKDFIYNGEQLGDRVKVSGAFGDEYNIGVLISMQMKYYGNKIRCTGKVLVEK